MNRRPKTIGYYIFYVLFLPDTWQVAIGILVAYIFTPLVLKGGMGTAAVAMLYLMIATIGYAASRGPARGITSLLKRLILGDRRP